MATLNDLVVDCGHPASLARFWAATLDGYEVAPYDDTELARLRAMGVHSTEDDPCVLVEPSGPGLPRLFFQRVPEPKVAKNRVHVDLRTGDLDAEVERLTGLGARVLRPAAPDGSTGGRRAVLADPEGNEFCVEQR